MANRTPLERAAITFVNAREKKAKLKEARGAQIKKCARPVYQDNGIDPDPSFVLHETCVYKFPKQPDQWCESCTKSRVLHEDFRATARKLIASRKTLITAVHTATRKQARA
jgi:hypothetical protein